MGSAEGKLVLGYDGKIIAPEEIKVNRENSRRREEVALRQVAGGISATVIGGVIGGIPYFVVASSDNQSIPLGIFTGALWLATPLLTSSVVVYAIGRLAEYDGSYTITLLSGTLPAVVFILALGVGIATEAESPSQEVFLGSLLLVPVAETWGFHFSDKKSNTALLKVDKHQISLSIPSLNIQSRQLDNNYWETDYTIHLCQGRF
jgi:hypothetical protein